jgi:CRISPR/Cas system CSM-associated protein Csm3 (group 7 of RAMP superfamily)
MFDTFRNRLIVDGYLVAESGLRVGTGRSAELVGTELPVIRDNHDRPFIPGSSFKGALRSHLEAVARGMAPVGADLGHVACNLTEEDEQCVQSGRIYSMDPDWEYPKDRLVLDKPVGIEDLRQGLDASGEDRDLTFTERLLANTCLVCRTFGSPWQASPVRVRDLLVMTDEWFGQFDVRDGVAIDRDKGTAADGKLYNYEVVPVGTRFELHIEAENLDEWQRGLLWLGLRALRNGDVALGGFTSRGLGWVKMEDLEAQLFEGAQALLGLMSGAEAGEPIGDAQAKSWVSAFRAELRKRGTQDA